MAEFEEIALPDWKIEYVVTEQGMQMRLTGASNSRVVIWPLCIEETTGKISQGAVGEQCPGVNALGAVLFSDHHGMFGKDCPSCGKYFRSNYIGPASHCAYCNAMYSTLDFLTENQLNFIRAYCDEASNALNNWKSTEIDIGGIITKLPANFSPFVYTQKELQSRHKCPNKKCRDIEFEILGDYGRCPCCGGWNAKKVVTAKYLAQEVIYNKANDPILGNDEQQREWKNVVVDSVTIFEAFGDFIAEMIGRVMLHPNRRQKLVQANFQRINEANSIYNEVFGFEFLGKLSGNEHDFMRKMYQQRHVLIHTGGKVDQGYITKSSDTGQMLGQTLRLQGFEVLRFFQLMKSAAFNFMEEVERIQPADLPVSPRHPAKKH